MDPRSSTPPTRQPSFHGEGGTLLGIYLLNLLLSVVTLGVYSFWGRAKVRRYLWGQTEFEGDRFAYHGTGGELFVGYLKIMGVFLLLVVAIILLNLVLGPSLQLVGALIFWLSVFALTPVAVIGARRYRLSRTSWRGIRFSLRGSTSEFVGLYLKGLLLSILTLGIYGVVFQTEVRRFLTERTWFGSEKFSFDGSAGELFPRYLRAILFSILTLGIYGFWWVAERERFFWNRTTFNGVRFRSTMTGGSLLGLLVVNALLTIFTLGIGGAWAMVRLRRYGCETLALDGEMDLAAVTQAAQAASAAGEGLADVLDTGGIDIGV